MFFYLCASPDKFLDLPATARQPRTARPVESSVIMGLDFRWLGPVGTAETTVRASIHARSASTCTPSTCLPNRISRKFTAPDRGPYSKCCQAVRGQVAVQHPEHDRVMLTLVCFALTLWCLLVSLGHQGISYHPKGVLTFMIQNHILFKLGDPVPPSLTFSHGLVALRRGENPTRLTGPTAP